MPDVFYPDGSIVPANQVSDAISKGEARWKTDADVHFVAPTGEGYTVKGTEAWDAIQKGWRPVSDEEFELKKSQRDVGIGDVAAAAAKGAASTLTFGASDVVGAGIAGEKQWRQIGEKAPIAETLGELGGLITPMGVEAATVRGARGGLMAVGRGVTAAPRAVSRFATGAGEVAASLLPETASLSRAVVKSGTAGAVEGFTFGAGRELSRQAMGDEGYSVEKILSAGGEGALFGGAIGGGVGGIGNVLGKGFTKATSAIDDLGARKVGAAERQAAKALGVTPYDAARIGAERVQIAAREALDQGVISPGIRSITESMGTKAFKLEKVTNSVGRDIGESYKALDKMGLAIDKTPLLESAAKQLGRLQDEGGISAKLGRRLEKDWVDRLTKTKTFDDVHRLDSDLYKEVLKKEHVKDDLAKKVLTEFRQELKQGLLAEVDRVAPGQAAKVRSLDKLYGALVQVSPLTTKAAEREAVAGQGALTGFDVGVGVASAVAGSPLGAIYGGVRTAYSVLRHSPRAAAGLAVALDNMRKASAAQGTKLVGAVTKAAEKGASPITWSATAKTVLLAKEFDERSRAAREASRSPEATAQRINHVVAPLAAADPVLARRAAMTLAADLKWLNDKAPRPVAPDLASQLEWNRRDKIQLGKKGAVSAPKGKGRKGKAPLLEVDTEAAASFVRTAKALADPVSAVAAIEDGKLEPETVEVLQVRRPSLLAAVEKEFDASRAELANEGKLMGYETRVQASLLVGKPYDFSMSAEFINECQAIYAERDMENEQKASSPPPQAASREARRRSEQYLTGFQELQSGLKA